jgi:hypothetical protein
MNIEAVDSGWLALILLQLTGDMAQNHCFFPAASSSDL